MTGPNPQSGFLWMLQNRKRPGAAEYVSQRPDRRWEYALGSKTSKITRDIAGSAVHTFSELVAYVEARIAAGDEQYTKPLGGGRRGDAYSIALNRHNTMLQAGNIYMDRRP